MIIENDNLQSETTLTQVTPSSPLSPAPNRNNKFFLVVGVVILLVLFSGVAYYLGTKGTKVSLITNQEQSQKQTTNNNPLPTTNLSQVPLFSGQLKKLNQNLQLFKVEESDNENNFVYYDAGRFNQGELKDYTRVIAVKPFNGPGLPLVYILATKDFQSYYLDDPENKTVKYPEDDYQNPYLYLDKKKILSAKTFSTELPKQLDLGKNFSLYAESFPTVNVETDLKDKLGNTTSRAELITDFFSYQKLNSPFKNLTIYFKPYQLTPAYFKQINKEGNYLIGDTEVIVVDSVGLSMNYSLTTSEDIKRYDNQLVFYEIAYKTYQDQLKKFQDKQISEYPKSPDYVYSPNFGFTIGLINNQNNLVFYKDYETALPNACASSLNTRVVNLNDNDLEQIGSVFNLPLYRLKDVNHPLYSLAFKNKMDYYDQEPTSWDQVNKGVKKPTLAEYVNSNPLLFVKDYWQRWVALGEFDIKLPGGCGKPVIYLYPKQPTEVSVKFQVPVQLTTDIPKYADFWSVLAYPNGSLVNLKPELTDCSQIDITRKGSEYAQVACQKNTYPYLYWAGNINSKNYPTIDKGWIIERNNLGQFLQTKLIEVGLNDKEKNDFMSYWLPEMIAKNVPYYRISFLQTNDLNSLFPMTVNPDPETIFRIFLDYSPLTEKPQNLPAPQVLSKLVRNGFTLVEWGGLKQP